MMRADAAAAGLQPAGDILIQLRNAVVLLDTSDPVAIRATVTGLVDDLDRLAASTTEATGRRTPA